MLRRRRRRPSLWVEDETDDRWLEDRQSRLPGMFNHCRTEGGPDGVHWSDEYAAWEQMGPETQNVIGELCVFKWSCLDICREMNKRGLHLLADDSKIAAECLKIDKGYRGSPSRDGMTMPTITERDRRRMGYV
jgi:hypothetical protein